MVEKSQAQQIVEQELAKHRNLSQPLELAIIDEGTIEEDFGWVFFYQSKQYLKTGDFQFLLAGNAPYIVNRLDGTIHVTGTAHPIEYYIENYRATGNPHGESSH